VGLPPAASRSASWVNRSPRRSAKGCFRTISFPSPSL